MNTRDRNMEIGVIMTTILLALVTLLVVMTMTAHVALAVSTNSTNSTSTNSNSTKVEIITIIKYLYYYVYYYMYPDLKWVFTLVNIGSQQAPGYHSVGNTKTFTPGFGGNGIFVPVYSQEAIYILNIAPSTKPVITGWYVGNTQVKGPYQGPQEVINNTSNNPPSNNTNNNYFVYVSVTNNTQGAGWTISSSADSLSGSGNINNAKLPIGGQTDTLKAEITNNPSNYTCTISPPTTQVTNGSTVTFTVSCTQSNNPGSGPGNYVYVTVHDDDGAGWAIDSSVASISGSSTVYNEKLQIGGTTDWIAATIKNYPLGYDCTITPPAEQAVAGYPYSFTVTCSPAYVYVTVNDKYNVKWTISSSIASISGHTTVHDEPLQIKGPSDTLTATVQGGANLGGFWYQCKISPSSTPVNDDDTVSFTVKCLPVSKV
jgi:hypothetical protein